MKTPAERRALLALTKDTLNTARRAYKAVARAVAADEAEAKPEANKPEKRK